MSNSSRLSLALESGDVSLPDAGRIAVFAPRVGHDLSALPADRCRIITGFRPDHDYFAGQGYACSTEPQGRFASSIVFIPRAKLLAQALIAQAVAVTDGPVIVDGTKTDGIESALRGCRARAEVSAPLSKSHGKVFWFKAGPGFDDWKTAEHTTVEGGFVTARGVFSADGPDPASQLLADHLPVKLGSMVADLGAGWGYLSARILERNGIEELHLVEADHVALACARLNVADARARLHWEGASRWQPTTLMDTVVTNPPFHSGREADPELGRAFIRSAAAMLKPRGQLFLVANRHLPYESSLEQHFAQASEIGGDNRFKILLGAKPRKQAR